MRSSASALPILAAAGLVLATTAPAAGQRAIVLPLCLGGSHALPGSGDEGPRPPKCPGACHAVCCRARGEHEFDDDDWKT